MKISKDARSILKGEQFGKVISERLSTLVTTYTDKNSRIQAANETGVGFQTVGKVATRQHVLAPTNEAGLVKLVELAIQKCDEALQAKNELADFLIPENSEE